MIRPLTRQVFTTISVLALLSVCSRGQAADYSAETNVGIDGRYDDNIGMSVSDPVSLYGVIATPSLTLAARTETTALLVDTRLDFSRYDNSGYNSDNQRFKVSASRQFERNYLGLDLNVDRSSTLESELFDSGRIGTNAARSELFGVSPTWRLMLTEKSMLDVNSGYSVSKYRDPDYAGYRYWSSTVEYSHAITERLRLNVAAQHSRYQSEDSVVDAPSQPTLISVFGIGIIIAQGAFGQQSYSTRNDSVGGQLGASYQINESNSFRLMLGRTRNKNSYDLNDPEGICDVDFRRSLTALCRAQASSNNLTTASLNWTWTGEQLQSSLQLTKSQQPSSDGVVLDATRVAAETSYRMRDLDKLSLYISATRNRAVATDGTAPRVNTTNRDYASATAEYQRELAESWYIEASYEYRYQQYRDFDVSARSKLITLGISYRPVARHWSR